MGPETITPAAVSDLDDWVMTEEELEVIDDLILSAIKSHSPSSGPYSSSSTVGSCHTTQGNGDVYLNRCRRLPKSLSHPPRERSHDASVSLHSTSSWKAHDFCAAGTGDLMMMYPALNFVNHILYSRTVLEVERATQNLLDFAKALKHGNHDAVFGLDIEWRPTFRKGASPGKAAVIQICGDSNCCHVMHIFHSGIPKSLQSFLEDPTCIKVGVGIANDSVKIFKDYNVCMAYLEDLSSLANQKLGDSGKWSLESLTRVLVSKQLLKANNIRLGNWEVAVLSKAQLQYAANDAYASWYLYQVLKTLPDPPQLEHTHY